MKRPGFLERMAAYINTAMDLFDAYFVTRAVPKLQPVGGALVYFELRQDRGTRRKRTCFNAKRMILGGYRS